MYDAHQTKAAQQHTQELLAQVQDGPLSPSRIEMLRDVLRFHEHRYYILADPLIADIEYDQLYKALEHLEKAHPELVTSDSPTQRVARELSKDFPTVAHLVPMLSLENSYNADDLYDWDRKARELSGLEQVTYSVEPKFDGASISLIYDNDFLVRGATRGDGVSGDDITPNIRQIRSVPLSAHFSRYGIGQIEIRGEVLINKSNFKKFNDGLAEQNLPPMANPRNAAAGAIRMKDPREVSRRNLEAFLYHVSYWTAADAGGAGAPGGGPAPKTGSGPAGHAGQPPATHSGMLDMLWNLGFRSPQKEKQTFTGIQDVIDYCLAFETQRDDLPYEIDGMVVKVNDLSLQERLGMTTHHPRWAIAYKFKARQATSTLRRVEFQVGRTGSVTPVAKIDPVPIGGVTVSSVSLFNEEVVREKDLKIGDRVLVERAGDVIPYIVKSLAELRDGSEQEITFPTHCPECGDALYKPEGEAVWRCININCPAQVVERIIHFVRKDAMDIRSLGEANVRRFFELGWLSDVPGIYTLPFDKIAELEGFGKKSITNLQTAIEASRTQPLHRLLFGLGIRYVGETTAKILAQAVDHLLDFKNFTPEQLLELEDVGPKVAGSVFQFFHNEDNLQMLEHLEALGLTLKNAHKSAPADGSLKDQTFLFTGTLSHMTRSEAEALVEQNGGKILGTVSSKLNYLVVGEDAGSKFEKAKKITSIRILSEVEFMKLVTP